MNPSIKVLVGYGIPLAALTVFYWVASDGNRPDASPLRGLLYWIFFLILPLGYATFVVHFLLTLCSPEQLRKARTISLLGGLVAPAFFLMSILTSDDGEAFMGLLALPLVYCFGVIVVAVVTVPALKIWSSTKARDTKPG